MLIERVKYFVKDKELHIDFSGKIKANKEGKTLNKPFRTPSGPKKFSVYVKNEKGNVVKVNFGDPNMEIKRDDPNRRKNFRARHNCDNPGPKTKARYWSCRQWRGGKKVEASDSGEYEWDGITIFDHNELLTINPSLAYVEEEITEEIEAGCGCDTGCGCGNNQPEEQQPCDCGNCTDSSCSCSCHQQDYASLWENIRKKKERIKSGSGEKMRKKGDKGAPTSEQMKKAKGGHMGELVFDNPSEAMKKAKEMGFDKIHSHKKNGETLYMPGPSHEALMKKAKEVDAASRPGPKSGAQTPSKPSERKKGSSKNKKGSAGKGGPSITFSAKVTESLKNKVKEHNAKSKKKVTLSQLKKVYRRGAGAFSQSHRPGQNRGSWAMARVNMFLKMKRGGKVKKSYRDADGDI